jgi:hypothetical protein
MQKIISALCLMMSLAVLAACTNNKSKPVDKTDAHPVIENLGQQINIAGKQFIINDSLVSQYLYMGTDTARQYLGIRGDSLFIHFLFIKPGGALDSYEYYKMAIANIDTQESYVEGVSLADSNAYQFKIIAKPEKTIKFTNYQSDGNIADVDASEIEVRLINRERALRMAQQLNVKWEVSE